MDSVSGSLCLREMHISIRVDVARTCANRSNSMSIIRQNSVFRGNYLDIKPDDNKGDVCYLGRPAQPVQHDDLHSDGHASPEGTQNSMLVDAHGIARRVGRYPS